MNYSKVLNFSNIFIESGIIFLLVFTPLAFGAVHIWAYSVMEVSVILLLGMWIIKSIAARRLSKRDKMKHSQMPVVNILTAAFVGLLVFQLVPFPAAAMKRLSAHTYDLYQAVLPGYDSSNSGSAESALNRQYEADAAKSDWRPISVYPYATRVEFLKILAYIGFFYLIIHNITTKKQINRLVLVIIAVGCFEAMYGLLEGLSGQQHIFFYEKRYYTDCVTGTFVNRNHFAGYLEMVISLCFGMIIYRWLKLPANPHKGMRGFINRLTSEQGSKLVLLVFAGSIMLMGLILSQSRMGQFSLLAALAVMTLCLMWEMKSRKIIKLISVVLLIGISGGIWLGLNPLIGRYALLPKEIAAEGSRAAIWRDTMVLIKDFPLWGSGLGSYRYIFPKYKRSIAQAVYHHAHNDYLELAAETGMVGFLIIMGLAGYFWQQVITKWHRRKSTYVKGLVFGCIGGGAAMLFHSFADFNMHIPANILLLTVIMGVSFSAVTQT